MSRVLITGGAGYVGARLVQRLIDSGHSVTVIDLMIYGNSLTNANGELRVIQGDIRDASLLERSLPGHDCVIHLACISNDPSFELDPALGRSINLDAFEPLVRLAKRSGVKRFIYASSSSVYGISEEPEVHEGLSLQPLTDYSLFKAKCEEVLQAYSTLDFETVTIRPATVCGFSPRQRLDVVVNIFTNLAVNTQEISVFGGHQTRPNLHIEDMVDLYVMLVEAPTGTFSGQIYNVGDENHSVLELAAIVASVVGDHVRIKVTESNDNRSYRISSQRIEHELGFKPQRKIRQAVEDLVGAFKAGLLPDSLTDSRYFNVRRMQEISLD